MCPISSFLFALGLSVVLSFRWDGHVNRGAKLNSISSQTVNVVFVDVSEASVGKEERIGDQHWSCRDGTLQLKTFHGATNSYQRHEKSVSDWTEGSNMGLSNIPWQPGDPHSRKAAQG